MPLGNVGGLGVMSTIATREATGDFTGDGSDNVSVFCHLEAEAPTLASTADLFLDRTPPQVHTIMRL